MGNFFPTDVLRPNGDCNNRQCQLRQREQTEVWQPQRWQPAYLDDTPVVHEDNDWGIELEGDDGGGADDGGAGATGAGGGAGGHGSAASVGGSGAPAPTAAAGHALASGLEFSHAPARPPAPPADTVVRAGTESLEELMARLKAVQR
jgi:hypothetical protein